MNNEEDENDYAVVEELPMENIISRDNISYDHVLDSASANTRHTTMSIVTRESCKDSKAKLIISTVVIVLILSAICGCTVYTLLELSRFKSEIAYINMVSFQTMNASLDVLHQQINDLAGTFNTSIQQIQVRQNEITNASLDVLNQQINDIAGTFNTSIQQIQVRQNEITNASLDVFHQQINDLVARMLNTSIEQIQVSENEITNASLDVLHQQINDLAGTLNTSIEQIQVRENEKQQITNTSLDMIHQQLRYLFGFHRNRCSAIFLSNTSSLSGYYSIRSSNGSLVRVYCDMTLSCGGVTGGWMRVANLDMTDNNTQCPGTLRERFDSTLRTCETPSTSTCYQITYSVQNTTFLEVCGKIRAYQVGVVDGFGGGFGLDGIYLVYGNPRQHIWTFVSAQSEVASPSSNCPCTNLSETSSARSPPAFVGNDYFCDTGSQGAAVNNLFYGDDPLWDGSGCGPLNTCCNFNNPPWFYKELPETTTDDIEMQVCRDGSDENIAIEMVDIYVR